MNSQERWVAEFVEELSAMEIICKPKAGGIVEHFYNRGLKPVEAATISAAHNAAVDYLNSMDGMLRAVSTARETLVRLRRAFDRSDLTREKWVLSCSIISPFLTPSEKTTIYAKELVVELGAHALSICIRDESDFEMSANASIKDAWDKYNSE